MIQVLAHAGRGLLEKAKRPSSVRAEEVKADWMRRGADAVDSEGGLPAAKTLNGAGDAAEDSSNPFTGRLGGAGGGRGRGRLQASQWSLAAEAKNSKRSRCISCPLNFCHPCGYQMVACPDNLEKELEGPPRLWGVASFRLNPSYA
jgi:hypothetical protein